MSAIIPITRERHAGKRWLRYTSYAFAAQDAVAPLVAAELPKAATALPVGLIARGQSFTLVAIMGLALGQNLLVSSEGQWVGRYVPAVYRGYPFHLLETEDGQQALCIDEDSGLLTDSPEGEPFFDDAGQPAKAVTAVLDFLSQVSVNRRVTERLCAVLQRHDLIQPWPIVVKGDAGEQRIEGLYQIDETALDALPAEAFLELRQAGALPVIYSQLLSKQHLAALGPLAEARAKVANSVAMLGEELDLEFLNQGGTIGFGNIS